MMPVGELTIEMLRDTAAHHRLELVIRERNGGDPQMSAAVGRASGHGWQTLRTERVYDMQLLPHRQGVRLAKYHQEEGDVIYRQGGIGAQGGHWGTRDPPP